MGKVEKRAQIERQEAVFFQQLNYGSRRTSVTKFMQMSHRETKHKLSIKVG